MDDNNQPYDRQKNKVLVNSRRCSTCLFWMDCRSPVSPEKAQEVIDANVANDAVLTCHQTLSYGDYPEFHPAVCGGYWVKYKDKVLAAHIAERFVGILLVDPPEG